MTSSNTQTERLDRFELVAQLAAGGMASVFLARLEGVAGFRRLYAIKRLHPHLAHQAEFVEMFLDEARLAARIRHPNVVPILEIGTSEQGYYLVMEYVEGDSAARFMARSMDAGGRLGAGAAIRIVLDALAGLHAAHEVADDDGRPLEIVHRDVSPQNILVGIDGTSRITDFGVARAATRLSNTDTGQLKGKLAYMAPEQALGVPVDRRADVWGMGVVLWEMLAADRLFKGSNDADTLNRLLNAPVPPMQESGAVVPPPIEAVCRRALARDRSERFSTAAEFGDELARVARSHGAIATRRELAALVEAAVAPDGAPRDSVRAGAPRSGIEAAPISSIPSSASPPKSRPRVSGAEGSASGVREQDRTPLPRAHGAPRSSVATEATRVTASAAPRQRRLLTIDDSPTVRKLIRVFLMGMEFEFIEAASAHLGLTALAESPFDLVIVDVNMPEMDGLAFLRAVRASPNPVMRRVPIVLLTGDKSARTRASAAELGASGFVLKPVTSSNLRETITELLRAGPSGH